MWCPFFKSSYTKEKGSHFTLPLHLCYLYCILKVRLYYIILSIPDAPLLWQRCLGKRKHILIIPSLTMCASFFPPGMRSICTFKLVICPIREVAVLSWKWLLDQIWFSSMTKRRWLNAHTGFGPQWKTEQRAERVSECLVGASRLWVND